MRALVWFRRDLRIQDNRALFHAARLANDGMVGVYVLTPQQWLDHDDAAAKVHFWLDNVGELSRALAKLRIPLLVKTVARFTDVPNLLEKIALDSKCDSLHFNREYEVNEQRRDGLVETQLGSSGIAVHAYHDRVILEPDAVTTKEGGFYSVFTPYRKAWTRRVTDADFEVLPVPECQGEIEIEPDAVPANVDGFDFSTARPDLWKSGEAAAEEKLTQFLQGRIDGYEEQRDLPAVNGTSLLSPYLAAGVISPRQCVTAGLTANEGRFESEGKGATTWLQELIWREFYNQVMVNWPRVSMHQPFQLKTKQIQWNDDLDRLTAWQQGRTGYPIVDAAMRQLNQTGWMHNRLRMVAAMFLSKHLFLDWRLGERYFMNRLVDGDLAANNGGWQWSASTGTDAAPYFRVFNPYSQSKRFDQEGLFIKRFCTELADVKPAALHDPAKFSADLRAKLGYPVPIVEHSEARASAIANFKALK